MPDSPERIFPLVRIATGDHRLLADHSRTLWPIRRCDGEVEAADG